MSLFDEGDPRKMPTHFFWGCLHPDYESAIKADITRQDYCSYPRHWYIDATFRCDRCEELFCFSAAEQKAWYEDYGIYVDSCPRHCRECRKELRDLKALQQEFDREITRAMTTDDLDLKVRLVAVIDLLRAEKPELPLKVQENRNRLARQIARRDRPETE